jgi:class 3 adenylate cyclase
MSSMGRVLVVDDNPQNVKLLGDMLSVGGYEVITAVNGDEALEKTDSEKPELILLDIMMPGMNGYEVCRRLKADSETSDIPVLFVTALGDAGDEAHGFELGGEDYITKPINTTLVEARVKTHLALYKQRKEIEAKNRELLVLSNKLSKYLSPQVYSSIFSGKQEVKIASERKMLTVLFADIVSFTKISESMDPQNLTRFLNKFLTEMTDIALQHGATVDKYIGDAVMMFFGDPETRGIKEDALACVRTAIAMQHRLKELHDHWSEYALESPIMCRIGVHSGYCAVGNFGSKDRMDYTIIGDVVNLTSRLEHEAPSGGILLSSDTYSLVKNDIRSKQMKTLSIRGVVNPVETYEVHV